MAPRIPLGRLVISTALALSAVLSMGAISASASAPSCGAPVCAPSIIVDKYGPDYVAQGANATYTYTVWNNGDQPLQNVVLSEDPCSPLINTTDPVDEDGVLEPGDRWYYECTYAPAGEPGDGATNTATVTAIYDAGKGSEVPVLDTDQHTTWIIGLQITKTVDKSTADPFDVLNYTITITNNGPQWAYLQGRVFEQDYGCYDLQSEDETSEGTYWYLNPGESVTYTCNHLYQPEFDGNSYTNTACADAYVQERSVEAPALAIQGDYNEYDIEKCASATTTLATHAVSGKVFDDLNADGAHQDGEPGLPGIVIYADLNGNGVRDAGEPSSTSDGQGNYSVQVALGTTTIRQEVPGGSTCSFPAGCAYTVDLPANEPPQKQVSSRAAHARAVDPGGRDFGDWRPASVSGTVAGDGNGNGTRDAGEGALGGVLVFADLNGNGTLDVGEPSATTSDDGSYVIAGLKPGGYVIRQVVPADRTCTAPASCNHNVTLTSNGTAAARDFLDAPPPGQLVLPERIIPGLVRLSGKTGCISGSGFYARVRGSKVNRVMFFIDGQYQKAVLAPNDNKTFRFRVDITKLKLGRHQLVVKVTFTSKSRTKSRTLRMSFQRCGAQLRAPQFTG